MREERRGGEGGGEGGGGGEGENKEREGVWGYEVFLHVV